MKTSIIILYVVLAGVLIIIAMQYRWIKKCKAIQITDPLTLPLAEDRVSSSFGNMLDALKNNVKELDIKF